ncbi:MAG: glycine zipper family protein [Bacteroidetes bacterium]|nr:MAG: glycine zipper family protein [Bacteroidota bacterium]
MKKTFLSIALNAILVLSFVFVSCNRVEENVTPTPSNEKAVVNSTVYKARTTLDYKAIYLDGLRKSVTHFNEIVSERNNVLTYTHSQTVGRHLNDTYFHVANFSYASFAQNPIVIPTSANDVWKNYSTEQQALLIPFYNRLQTIVDVADAEPIVVDLSSQIEASNLDDAEKEQLRSFAGGVLALVTFINEGGIDDVQNVLGALNNNNGLQARCSISSRTVLIGAVVGSGLGAIKGAFAGGIYGAAFGGAWGFVSGAATSIVGQLIATCGR